MFLELIRSHELYPPNRSLNDYLRPAWFLAQLTATVMRALGNNRERNYSDVTLEGDGEILLFVADVTRDFSRLVIAKCARVRFEEEKRNARTS